ncbi:hypothetical protein C8R47DRAFT_1199981 [Mycena vitilis]|nr:hypothetical protein C8R47DRAFT_1199981 [Mycena vitilis]
MCMMWRTAPSNILRGERNMSKNTKVIRTPLDDRDPGRRTVTWQLQCFVVLLTLFPPFPPSPLPALASSSRCFGFSRSHSNCKPSQLKCLKTAQQDVLKLTQAECLPSCARPTLKSLQIFKPFPAALLLLAAVPSHPSSQSCHLGPSVVYPLVLCARGEHAQEPVHQVRMFGQNILGRSIRGHSYEVPAADQMRIDDSIAVGDQSPDIRATSLKIGGVCLQDYAVSTTKQKTKSTKSASYGSDPSRTGTPAKRTKHHINARNIRDRAGIDFASQSNTQAY